MKKMMMRMKICNNNNNNSMINRTVTLGILLPIKAFTTHRVKGSMGPIEECNVDEIDQ